MRFRWLHPLRPMGFPIRRYSSLTADEDRSDSVTISRLQHTAIFSTILRASVSNIRYPLKDKFAFSYHVSLTDGQTHSPIGLAFG